LLGEGDRREAVVEGQSTVAPFPLRQRFALPPPRDKLGEDFAMIETAYAKINLALHVRRRREDGYHELETLFAFVDAGDRLSVAPAARDELRTVGEFGQQLTDPFDNIVMKALSALPRPQGWAVTLEKNLPVAAGLGGGSADAGALFRLYDREYGLPDDWQARAAKLGADVPACVRSEVCVGRGTGTELEPVVNDLAGTPVLLVNPRLPLATGPVFKGWDGIDHGPLPEGTASEIAFAGRNDLEASAIAMCPQIAEVLGTLHETGPLLGRMSGSGATCFSLYASQGCMEDAQEAIRSARTDWWCMTGYLR
jgi:4-diphosphocytidyl-2-C-methyl-D-erythritol kinase